jgi:hypothetical protein
MPDNDKPGEAWMEPLEMAWNLAAHVEQYARVQDEDPVTAHVNRLGQRGWEAVRLAGYLALVSIVGDFRRFVDRLPAEEEP